MGRKNPQKKETKRFVPVRINRELIQAVKEETKQSNNLKTTTLSDWVEEAVKDFLDEEAYKYAKLDQNKEKRQTAASSIALTPEVERQIRDKVAELKKTNPKYSVTIFFNEAIKRKIKN